MEIEDFDLIQEMAAAQKALDEVFYKNGSKMAHSISEQPIIDESVR